MAEASPDAYPGAVVSVPKEVVSVSAEARYATCECGAILRAEGVMPPSDNLRDYIDTEIVDIFSKDEVESVSQVVKCPCGRDTLVEVYP